MTRFRTALLALLIGVSGAALLPAPKANAWWGPWRPRWIVPVPAPILVPRPVYVGPPPVYYAPYPHHWVRAHWDAWGRWIPGHWV